MQPTKKKNTHHHHHHHKKKSPTHKKIKPDTSRSGYNEIQPDSIPGKKKI